MEQHSFDNSGSSRFLNEQLRPIYTFTLVDIPIELLVYIISYVISTRDRVKFRYVSQRLRAAVETPSLWRDFSWPHFDFREERAIKSALKSCGRHVKRLSFPNLVIPVESLQYCGNVLRLSFPSVQLSLNQLRTLMQCMKKLQYLEILWTSKIDIKHLLLMVGYPVYGYAIKELTVREQVKDSSFDKALHFLLNEWTALRLMPCTINIVTSISSVLIKGLLEQWGHFGMSRSADHIGHLNIYRSFTVGLVPIPPMFQYQIFGLHCLNLSFVLARNYGLLGLADGDNILLTSRTIDDGNVLHKGTMRSSVQGTPLNIISIKFLTHFNATGCGFFYSGHLEQLAIACPNLQLLNLRKNVNCLRNLRGLHAIATACRKLKGVNISGISVDEVENCTKLWEILVDLQLTYLSIDLCCLLCFEGDDHTNEIIIGLHQNCLKMKSLESFCFVHCTKCVKTEQPLQLSNFPALIHCVTTHINDVNICERLRYLWYRSENIWWPWSIANCNLQELCIESRQLALPDSFMNKISVHGGLVHVILNVNAINQNGIAILIGNSPNLITYHVYIRWLPFDPKKFKSTLEKKYSDRKLFLYGSCCLAKGEMPTNEFHNLLVHGNLNFVSFWHRAF